jgi:hypothetical protein
MTSFVGFYVLQLPEYSEFVPGKNGRLMAGLVVEVLKRPLR